MSVEEDEKLAAGLTEAILGAVTDGISVQDAEGRLVYANDAAAQLSGFGSAAELIAAAPSEIIGRFELLDEQRRPLSAAELPGRLALADGVEHELTVCWRIRSTGEERWSFVRALPVEAHGSQYAVNLFRDITEQKRVDDQLRLLADASELLVSSLDVDLTLDAIGTMLVPGAADYCLIDLLEEDGSLRQVVQRHADPERERVLRELRRLYPPGGNPAHPAMTALASGEPVLIEHATDEVLRNAALNDEHLALYRALDPASYLVVPLIARGRTIGAMSLGMGESGRRYGTADILFAQEIAGRISLALDNARLFANARSSYALLDTLLVSAPVGIGFWDRDLRFVRVNDALAAINGLPAEEHAGKTLGDVKPELAPTLEPLYRRVIETGKPVAHSETTDELGLRAGDRRHWLSSYYPVRTADGEVTGVGAVIMDVTAQRRADDRLRLLARAGELFASSLDADDVFARILDVVVPGIADSLHIFIADGDQLRRVACAHVDPELLPVLESLPSHYPLGPDSPMFMAAVFERGEPVVFDDVAKEVYERLAENGASREAMDRIGSRSMMLVPLVARGESLGVMAIGSREAGRYTGEYLALALELAGRAAVTIDNARLFHEASFRRTLLEAQQEASIDGLLLVSPTGELLSYNRRFAEIWRMPEDVVASGSDETALANAVEWVLEPEAFLARVHEAYERREPTRDELALVDGRTLERHGTPVRDEGGAYHGYLWSFRDVTEARRDARELERRAQVSQALEFVGDGVFLLDRSGVVRLWNPAAAAITGLEEAVVVGASLAETLPGWTHLERLIPVAALDRRSGLRAETLPLDVGGRELWLSISGVDFRQGVVYAFRDVTEERDVDRLKSDFVSTVSHELRTPLAAIYGAAMTLRREDVPLSPVQRDGMLEVVSGEAERLARIVNDILLASRLDSDVVDVAIGLADAAELTRGVVAAAAAHLPPGIELTLSAPDDLPPIAADPDKLRQVLVNLVENAVKYSPDGGPVEVGLALQSHQMRFSVKDSGLGIPASEHGRIFEKFYRVDPNLTRGVGGTGLGLYICREIVRRMNGRIWLESQPGRGSTFFFEIPLA